MLVIHDEQLARQLQRIAEREKRPVEDVLKSPHCARMDATTPSKSLE